jgi:hypothetical protein
VYQLRVAKRRGHLPHPSSQSQCRLVSLFSFGEEAEGSDFVFVSLVGPFFLFLSFNLFIHSLLSSRVFVGFRGMPWANTAVEG